MSCNMIFSRKSGTTLRRTIIPGIVLALLFALMISGCSKENEAKQLVVYTYDAFPEPLITLATETFQSREGVTVRFERFSDTGGIFNQIRSEHDDPIADVVVGLDTTFLDLVIDEKLFEVYKPKVVDELIPETLADPTYHSVVFDYGGITLNYDTELLPEPPTSWQDLLDPSLAKSIVIMNPETSSPGRNFLLFSILEFGEAGYLDFWTRLKPNILTITGSWYEGYGLYTQGEAPLVLSYETSPAYHIEYESTDRYANVYLDGKAYGQMEIAGIVTGTRQRKHAEKFIELLLSVEFQSEIALNQFMYPVRKDVEIPGSFVTVLDDREIVTLDPALVSANIERWLKEWEATMR